MARLKDNLRQLHDKYIASLQIEERTVAIVEEITQRALELAAAGQPGITYRVKVPDGFTMRDTERLITSVLDRLNRREYLNARTNENFGEISFQWAQP